MALREFEDELGRHWQVWSTQPRAVTKEERVRTPLAGGWLTFMTGKQRRRLAPIPDGWADATDEDLREMLRASLDAPAFRRLP